MNNMPNNIKTNLLILFLCLFGSKVLYSQEVGGIVVNKFRHAPLLLNMYNTTINGESVKSSVSAAYSVRRINLFYSGPLMKIRRNSDNATLDVYYTANNGLDVTAITTFVGSNSAYVTTWYDQSGNGNNAVQNTFSAQPQIVKSGALVTENGFPSIEFSGPDNAMNLVLNSKVTLTDGTLFGVTKVVNGSNTCGIAQSAATGVSGVYSYNLNTWPNSTFIGITSYGVIDAKSTMKYNANLDVISWSKSSANNYVEVNNRIASSTVSLNVPISIYKIYGNSVTGANLHVSEFIVTGYTTVPEKTVVFSNQQSYYGTP